MEPDCLHNKDVLAARIKEFRDDYDFVREDMEDHLNPTPAQWFGIDILCETAASLMVAMVDAMRAGFEPNQLA